jgi:pimeloyl-ACP methyl ester carboxylesterase
VTLERELVAGRPDLPPLVFLHEGLGSLALWRDFPVRVAAACGGPTTLVYSRAGYGHSPPASLPRPVTYMHDEVLDSSPARATPPTRPPPTSSPPASRRFSASRRA